MEAKTLQSFSEKVDSSYNVASKEIKRSQSGLNGWPGKKGFCLLAKKKGLYPWLLLTIIHKPTRISRSQSNKLLLGFSEVYLLIKLLISC